MKFKCVTVVLALMFVVSPVPDVARGQCTAREFQKVQASDGDSHDNFGFSVSINGDVAIVGARDDDDKGADSGSAHIFRFDGSNWNQEAKLLAGDGEEGDEFGVSVSLDGDVALVGSPKDDDNGADSGSAYIFRFDGTNWNQEGKLLASDGAAEDWFGGSVSLDGDVAIVGARRDDDKDTDSGSAYIFRFDGSKWTQEGKLLADDSKEGDQFGVSVSIDGDVVLIGAYLDDDNRSNSGSVYVFRFDGSNWKQEVKLLASDGAREDRFGSSISLRGEVALVGAYWDDDNGSLSGSAYIFRFDGSQWNQEAKLLPSDGEKRDHFGVSVSIDSDVAIIGAVSDEDNGPFSGSAYIFLFDGSNWNQEAKLLASDGVRVDQFGFSVSIDGDAAIVGAINNDGNERASGSAYVFDLDDLECCTGKEKIKNPKCKESGGKNKITVKLKKGFGGDSFVVELSSGEKKDGTLNRKGNGKAKFSNLPSGRGTATATWGCGAKQKKDYVCP